MVTVRTRHWMKQQWSSTDSEDDEEFADAEAGAGPGVSWAAG